MKRKKTPAKHDARATPRKQIREKATFMEHVAELRRRLFFIVLSIAVWSCAAYAVEHQIINILLRPSHGQNFIYTSPIGGMNFLFRVCVYVGVMFSIPVIVYQFLRYIEPLMKRHSARFIRYGSLASGLLAIAGIIFGYFIGLPAALNFLLHQFITAQIHPLLTIEAYLSFVTVYMLGAALMFQVPLIVLFINRIKPLKPQELFRHERWVIVFSVVLALIMNPTPNLIDQIFVAGPIILSYQLAIAIIWWVNRKPAQVHHMRLEDARHQLERIGRADGLQPAWQLAEEPVLDPEGDSQPPNYTATPPPAITTITKPAATPQRTDYQRRPVGSVRPRPLRGRYIQ